MALSRESTLELNVWDREAQYRELLNYSRLVEESNGQIQDLNFFRSYNTFTGQVNFKESILTKQLFDANKGVSKRLILKIIN